MYANYKISINTIIYYNLHEYIISIDTAYYVALYKFKISKLLTVNNLNYKWLLTRNLSIIIITSTTERRYYLCSGCYTYGMHDHVIPCLYPNRTFFVPKQDVFFNTTKYAILCNNNAIFRGNGVITQDYAHFWEFRDIA